MAKKDLGLMMYKDQEPTDQDGVVGPGGGGFSSPVASQPDPEPMDDDTPAPPAAKPEIPMLSADDLAAKRAQQARLLKMGAIADNLGNRQSFGNFFLGRMNPTDNSVSKLAAAKSGLIDQQIADTKQLQNQAMKAPEMQTMQDAMDKDSDFSKAKQGELQATLSVMAKMGQMDPAKAKQLADQAGNMNGFQAGKILESMKPMTDVLRAQGMLALAGRKVDQADQRLGIQKDNQAASAAGAFDKDPLMQSTQRQLNQIGIDRHTLQNAKIITPQMVHEIGAGVAMALSGGKAVGLGQMELQDMGTAQTKLAALEQMLTNEPQNGASEPIKAQIVDTLDRLEDSYKKVQSARVNQLKVGKNYSNNPSAQQAIQQKVQSYQQQQEPNPAPTSPADEDKDALQWAKDNPKDPRATKILMKLNSKFGGQ